MGVVLRDHVRLTSSLTTEGNGSSIPIWKFMQCSSSCAGIWGKIPRFPDGIPSLLDRVKRELRLGCEKSWLTFKGLMRRRNWREETAPVEKS